MKTLIVYYSQGGNTEYAAEKVAERIGADTLRLVPVKAYRDKGLAKFVWGGRAVLMADKPKLEKYRVNLSRYDRIVIGFPVWASSFAPPIRTFVADHKKEIAAMDVAAFACQGGRGAEKAFAKLRKLIGIEDFEAEGIFIEPKTRQSDKTDKRIQTFADELADNDEIMEMVKEEELEEALTEKLGEVLGVDLAAGIEKAAEAISKLKDGGARDYFSHWNYRKHAKFCTAVYLTLFTLDMTVSYFICKKVLDRVDRMREEEE